MSNTPESQHELEVIESVADAPPVKKFLAYAKISGPGWLQGAITLGGGSLAGALYLGTVSGFGLMWLQPLAMVCGIIMLSAIAYVTLSSERRPFHAINRHLNPLLGWSWLIATIMANIVWSMPQFALATAAIQQNLLSEAIPTTLIVIVLFVLGMVVNGLYQSGSKGTKAFDLIIKIMVGIIVLSFFAVVITLTRSGVINWGGIFKGFLPNPSFLFNPSASYTDLIAQSSDAAWWTAKIARDQKDIIITAFGTAVGINMTFLLPYSLLRKRWGAKHRGLSITDLSIGLFVPFFLATACVVIAAASSFHAKTDDLPPGAGRGTLLKMPKIAEVAADEQATELALAALPEADHTLAAMLTKRDANALAITLEPLAGPIISQKIFGVGVLGMAVSTIIILMLMNGLAFQEAFSPAPPPETPGEPDPIVENKALYFVGCAVSGLAGASFPFLWTGQAKAALAVPTSVIGGSLIPIAYFTFLLMMNSKKILGPHRPKGTARVVWNALMIFATSVATFGSIWVLLGKSKAPGWIGNTATFGIAFLVILFIVGTISFILKERDSS